MVHDLAELEVLNNKPSIGKPKKQLNLIEELPKDSRIGVLVISGNGGKIVTEKRRII